MLIMTHVGAAKDLVKNKGLYVNKDAVLDTRRTVTEADLLDGRFVILSAGAKKRLVLVASEP
jgi:tyrosyl-tRNA synthetase